MKKLRNTKISHTVIFDSVLNDNSMWKYYSLYDALTLPRYKIGLLIKKPGISTKGYSNGMKM